jgi:serine/threonine protein kinase
MPPFYSKQKEELFHKIRYEEPVYPEYLSIEAVDLISQLLTKDPSMRLISAQAIKSHAFFQRIDWK